MARRPPSSITALGQRAQPPQLLGEADQRVHDLDLRGRRATAGARPRRSRAPASRRSRGAGAQPAAARAEHRVLLVQRLAPAPSSAPAGRSSPAASPARAAARSRPSGRRRSGRNSCSGGSSSRMVTGSPAIASKMPSKSACWNGSSRPAPRAARPRRRPGSSRCTTGSRSSPKNMCSVRHRPMPSAPSSRALAASAGVSALARTRSRRTSSAQPVIGLEVLVDLRRHERHRAQHHLAAWRRRS